jgi:hypothetical protein
MRCFLICGAVVALLVVMWPMHAADCRAEERTPPVDSMRQRRLELLESHVDKLRLSVDDRAAELFKRGKQPILHWSNPVREYVNDGVTFLFFAAADGKDSEWRYTVARMTSFQVTLRLDDREIFSVGPYWQNPRAPTDPYSEANDGPFTLDDPARERP